MKKQIILLISLFIPLTTQVHTATAENARDNIPYYVVNAANAFNLDVGLMYAICQQESRCRARAINHDDASKKDKALGIIDKSYGMFQIKVSTAIGLGFKQTETIITFKKLKTKTVKITKVIDHTRELMNPEVNAYYAAKLLKQLYKRYHDTPKVISAYNAGRYIKSNKAYVHSVMSNYVRFKIDKRS